MTRTAGYVLAGLFALTVGGLAALWHYSARPGNFQIDTAFWNTTLPDTAGRPEALSQWRGKILVFNFWATWCPPCREEIPDFVALRAQFLNRNVEFVGIALDNVQRVNAFAREMNVPYPLLIGEGTGHALAQALGNPSGALPYTVVIDRSGLVVMHHLGRLPRAKLESALAHSLSQ